MVRLALSVEVTSCLRKAGCKRGSYYPDIEHEHEERWEKTYAQHTPVLNVLVYFLRVVEIGYGGDCMHFLDGNLSGLSV
jgi:hypothetical protein